MRKALRAARWRGIATSLAAYIVAVVVAVVVVRAVDLGHPLAVLGLGTVVATLMVFAVSVLTDNSSIYDPYWSVQPLAIAGYYLWVGRAHLDARLIIVACLILLYSLRLTSNFYRDWPGLQKEDFRYAEFRQRFGRSYWLVSLLGIHLFPTILVYAGCLPLYAVTRPGAGGVGVYDGVGMAVTLGAVMLAYFADGQLRRFRTEPDNRGKVAQGGLWSASRHPNYLGEVLTWWGLWFFALAAGLRWWWTVVGAAAITLMFLTVSIPWMERRMLATRSGYQRYREDTPVFLPIPRMSRR